jgi:UDP-N-acetylglucosamine transferase subunit ALG13
LSASEFGQSCRNADVVVTHAGVGTLMNLFDMGISPVVAPRRAARHEHVDDHQSQIAGLLRTRSIGRVTEVEQLDREAILAASGTAIQRCATGGRPHARVA